MRYGTLDEHGRPVYFTGTIYVDGKPVANPSREMYLAHGQKPFIETKPPAAKSGTHYVRAGWTEHQTAIVPKWKIVEDPSPRVRTFDKYKIVDALMKAEAWDCVKAWLQSVPDAYDRAVMAPDISEDEPLLKEGIAEIKKLLGWTDEQVEEVLSKSVQLP